MSSMSWNILSSGVHPELPQDKARRARLVNISALLAAATTVPYLIFFYINGFFLANVALGFLLCFCSTWLLNRYGFYKWSRNLLYLFSCLYLFVVASSLGREAAHHLMLIPVLLSVVVVFEFDEKLTLYSMIGLVLSAFLLLELTDFSLFSIELSPQVQRYCYYGSLSTAVLGTATIGVYYFYLYSKQLRQNELMVVEAKEIEQTVNYFSTSLFGKNSVDEILWDVAKNCIGRLGFVDCVIYLVDEERKALVQKAAYGTKNPKAFEIYKPIDIPIGKGIVGAVAESAGSVIVPDTSIDKRYIPDDANRLSELAVPLIYNKKVIGVIDSEHPDKYFFTEHHLNILKTIASLCANKVIRAMAEKEREQAFKIQVEAEKIKSFDELKSRLFANVSHELRTPLTLIIGTIERQLEAEKSSEWKLLQKHTDRLLRLINQLLDLSKLESGQFSLRNSSGDIVQFFHTIIDLLTSFAEDHDVTLHIDAPKSPLWLGFDDDAMEKIFFNLLSNAIKFSKKGASVKLKLSYNESLIVKIKDDGVGITEEEIEKIFDRYYQADSGSSIGTGLGLSLTKELIDLHEGTIEVNSILGSGSEFIVKLPLKKMDAPLEPKRGQVNEIDGSKDFILLVEDHDEISSLIESTLDGFQIIRVRNGKEAIDLAQERVPDLIITDIMMPEMDGLAYCQWVRENEMTSHIPLIILTAKADDETKMAGLQAGADAFMTKPFYADELKVRVGNIFQGRKRLKEKYKRIIALDESEIVITSSEDIFLKKLIHITQKNLSNSDFGANELSKEMALSRMQLHRKITALTDHSTSSFIRHFRLSKAAKMLESGESVSQVAYAVGFSSLSYFTKTFKEVFGSAPSTYARDQLTSPELQ